ncbi:hypothetical protein [Dorea formicigenerans]|uniref:hypothetical protein n=1 Tax=Dorea formicigenerans TaxID=39486 RepID=UPI001A9C0D97|nr:hypothetical protein [Dorea formicigenerans]
MSLYNQFYNPCKYTIEASLAQEMKLIQTIFVIELCQSVYNMMTVDEIETFLY